VAWWYLPIKMVKDRIHATKNTTNLRRLHKENFGKRRNEKPENPYVTAISWISQELVGRLLGAGDRT